MADALRLIRESVQADIDAGEDLYILEESDGELTVVDDTEGHDRAIRYTAHDRITPAWVEERILVTESAKQCRYTVNTKILAEYLTRVVPKDVLHTLEKIIIVTDDEKDWEELFPQLEDRHGNPILEVCDLPDETLVGYQWAMYQVVLINLKAVSYPMPKGRGFWHGSTTSCFITMHRRPRRGRRIGSILLGRTYHRADYYAHLCRQKLSRGCLRGVRPPSPLSTQPT